jgi:aryl-alcohol dehydrogenase-like predicted oxidoreductase
MGQNEMLQRRFGGSNEKVSAIGLGGYHIGKPEDPDVGVEIVRTAIDSGITFLDNSWDYHEGESELRMGRALRDGYRERAFVMTKLDSRTADGTLRQFEESMSRLELTSVDLLQLHEVIREDDVDKAFAPGGAIETYLELKEQGAARFIGFTGHKDPEIHVKMLLAALDRGIVFDAVQMPVSPFDANFRSFSQRVIPICREHDIAVIGMKSLGSGRFVDATSVSAPELLRWSLSQPITTLVTGCETLDDVKQAAEVGTDFVPVSTEEQRSIAEQVAEVAADGRLEEYKTDTTHDATSDNPHWLA